MNHEPWRHRGDVHREMEHNVVLPVVKRGGGDEDLDGAPARVDSHETWVRPDVRKHCVMAGKAPPFIA
jgi:hypothetical protein